MIEDTDRVWFQGIQFLKYRQSLNGISITERTHSEKPQRELSKALTGSRLS